MNSSINIKFDHLSYSVKTNFFKGHRKEILKEISGCFKNNELTAILGPSGCGKSTLLNMLSGFQRKNVDGKIEMNGKSIGTYRKNIAYMMQDNNLPLLLTVSESMNFAIKFKIGNNLNSYKKWQKIAEILKNFGLQSVENEFVKNLSGGQQKRLSMALEVVDDPYVIFLDEPTTGLDSSSSTICINLMKQLASENRTVVCTIHQPSGSQLRLFDHLYVLSKGECVYQGTGNNLVVFLKELNLPCPESYNPADFLLEAVTGIYGEHNHELMEKIENGRNENYRSKAVSMNTNEGDDNCFVKATYSPSILSKFNDLVLRNFIIMIRDRFYTNMRMLIHIFVGLLLGCLYYDIGDDAQYILSNFRLIFVTMSFITYTSYYSIMVVFPVNYPLIKRETFNRWYSSSEWFFATLFCDFPVLILANLSFVIPVYYMTSQPLELFRFLTFTLIIMLNSFCSQAFGIIAGSMSGLKETLILAPILILFHGVFSGFYIFKKDANPFWRPFFELSYLKYSAYGTEISVLGFNRTKMECGAFYCHFRSPQKFLQAIEYDEDYTFCVWMLLLNYFIFILIAYTLIRRRLKK